MEVVWNVVTVILNRFFAASITFHEFLHGSRAGCKTGVTTLEEKLLQQLVAMREEVQCLIFLKPHKVYDTLDRDRCLDTLEGYGVVPHACRILQVYWDVW